MKLRNQFCNLCQFIVEINLDVYCYDLYINARIVVLQQHAYDAAYPRRYNSLLCSSESLPDMRNGSGYYFKESH